MKKLKPLFKSKLFLASLCCLFLIVLINACKKNENVNQPPTPASLISEAKTFFKENVLKDELLILNGSNAIQNLKKTPVWEKATVRKISLGDAVIVPIKYDGKMYLKKGGSDEMVSIEETSYMMIYDDKKGNKQIERVTLMPYEPAGKRTGEFIGIISVEDWQGNFKKGYAVGKGGKAVRVKLSDGVNFKQAAYYGDWTCWIFTWYSQTYSSGCGCWGPINEIGSSQFCFFDQGDGTISEEVDGPTDDNHGGEGATNSNDYTPPPPASTPTVLDSLYKILSPAKTCLNTEQMQALTTTFGSYLSGEDNNVWACLQRSIYKKIEASGKKFGFCVDPQIPGAGGYDPQNGNFLWKDGSYISNVITFSHEFFHGFQDTHYAGGTNQYKITGFPNMEFEQALFNDIINGSSEASGMGSTAPVSVKDEYQDWIKTITNNNTTYPKLFSDFTADINNNNKYYHFLNLFYQHSPYANKGVVNTTLQPSALLNIFSTSNCK